MRWLALALLFGFTLHAETLPAGETVDRRIAVGAVHEYTFPVSSDTYFELLVEPNGARIEIGVAGISRKMSTGEMLPSALCWIAQENTAQALRVSSLETREARKYRLTLISRTASSADRARAGGCGF